jgi:bacteriorhodopsin
MSEPKFIQDPKTRFVKLTFYITYVMLLTTGTITFIEALRTKIPEIRHIMNIETCISIVAAYFYTNFIAYLSNADLSGKPIDFDYINQTRYTDWFITTPLMLLALCLVLTYQNKTKLHFTSYLIILLLNFGMILAGYLGETNYISKMQGLVLGFAFFVLLFGYIWLTFLTHNPVLSSVIIFYLVALLWSLYGVVYMFEKYNKNVSFNILDLIAKCIVGIFFWVYFTHILVF